MDLDVSVEAVDGSDIKTSQELVATIRGGRDDVLFFVDAGISAFETITVKSVKIDGEERPELV